MSVSVKDIERLVDETLSSMQKTYVEEGAIDQWATDQGISPEAFNHILTGIGVLLLDDVKEMMKSLTEGVSSPEAVMELLENLRCGVAMGLITGIEIQRQYLSPKTELPEV